MKRRHKIDISIDGILRLIEGMMVYALDKASISTKFRNKIQNRRTLNAKRKQILEVKDWVGSENWSIWLGIYTTETGINERRIRKNFEKTVKQSLNYTTRALKKLKKKNGTIQSTN